LKLLLQKIKEICGVSARQARFEELERICALHAEKHAAHEDAHTSHRGALRTIGELNGLDEARLEKLADAVAETYDAIALRRGHPLGKDFRDIWRRAQ
jgi:hypothetical protein